jgi:hypothetical protein
MANFTGTLTIDQTFTIIASPKGMVNGVLTPLATQEPLVGTVDPTSGSVGSFTPLGLGQPTGTQNAVFTPAKIGTAVVTVSTQPPDVAASAQITLTVTGVPVSEIDLSGQANG